MFEPLLLPAAFLAGVLMFLAPCTLPIVPGYLAFIAGGQGRIMRNAFAFVIGFSLMFIVFGAFAGTIGALVGPWRELLSRAAGLLLVLFGLTMLGAVHLPMLSATSRPRIPRALALGRPESSFVVGALFAFGWSPCIGPILGTVLLLASQSATAPLGALLLGVFSLGLGLPFLLTALAIERAGAIFARTGAMTSALSTFGGIALLVVGALILTGTMGPFVSWALSVFNVFYTPLLQYM